MAKDKLKFLQRSILIIDLLLTINAFYFSYYIRNVYFGKEYGYITQFNNYTWILVLAASLMSIFLVLLKSYEQILEDNFAVAVFKIALSIFLSVVFLFAVFFFIGEKSLSRLFFGIFSCVEFIIIAVDRIFIKTILYVNSKDTSHGKNILIVGCGELGRDYFEKAKKYGQIGVNIVGFLRVDGHEECAVNEQDIVGSLNELKHVTKENSVDEVVFALPLDYYEDITNYVQKCEVMGITVHVVLDLYKLNLSKGKLNELENIPCVTIQSVSNDYIQLFVKRAIDIIGGMAGMVLILIALVIVGPLIYIESPGNIFFKQKRVGKNGRVFNCYKFRSMYMDAEERKKELLLKNEMNGAMFKIKDDPRITRIGKFIRATSIDELPQFLNVLLGDMSLVGTRPPTTDEVDQYKDYHWRRLSVKPGITGLWQVSGRSDIVDFEDVVKLDTQYIDNWSVWLDIKLIFKTMKVIVARAGAR